MRRIILSSPAKLNLYLKVNNKRPDGYHNIITVFERIDLVDRISFEPLIKPTIKIVCNAKDVPTGPKNLAYKAAELLWKETGVKKGVLIRINKRIPVAAGLAGGSSNAATALIGLNRIWNLGLSRSKLRALAAKIGSDVPFFLYNASWALGTRRGERIKTLDIRPKYWHILVVPKIKMYSWKVYGGLKLKLTKIPDNAKLLIHNLKKDKVLEVSQKMANGLEREVLRLAPQLKKLKKRLKSMNARGVMVSGSGPSVFGLTGSKQEAELIKSRISKRYSQVFVVRTL